MSWSDGMRAIGRIWTHAEAVACGPFAWLASVRCVQYASCTVEHLSLLGLEWAMSCGVMCQVGVAGMPYCASERIDHMVWLGAQPGRPNALFL